MHAVSWLLAQIFFVSHGCTRPRGYYTEAEERRVTVRRIALAAFATIGTLAFVITALAAPDPAAERFWHQWRGPYATGVSKYADPPLEWSETKNIRWKVEIPGRASASPVVWGDRIFLLTAVPGGVIGAAAHAPQGGVQPRHVHRFVVLAIDRKTGKTI